MLWQVFLLSQKHFNKWSNVLDIQGEKLGKGLRKVTYATKWIIFVCPDFGIFCTYKDLSICQEQATPRAFCVLKLCQSELFSRKWLPPQWDTHLELVAIARYFTIIPFIHCFKNTFFAFNYFITFILSFSCFSFPPLDRHVAATILTVCLVPRTTPVTFACYPRQRD